MYSCKVNVFECLKHNIYQNCKGRGGQGGQRSVGFHSKTRICIMTHVTTYSWLYLDIILQDVEVLVGEVLRNVSEHS